MTTKLSQYINDAPALKMLAERLRRVRDLQRFYSSITPHHLANSSRIGDVNGKAVFIIAFNGTAAAQLKQRLPSLLASIQQYEPEVSVVHVEVQIEKFYTAPQQKGLRRLSSAGAGSLKQLAMMLPESRLQHAVGQLAARALDQNHAFYEVKERNSSEKDDKKPK